MWTIKSYFFLSEGGSFPVRKHEHIAPNFNPRSISDIATGKDEDKIINKNK